jgi:hypothetical protein
MPFKIDTINLNTLVSLAVNGRLNLQDLMMNWPRIWRSPGRSLGLMIGSLTTVPSRCWAGRRTTTIRSRCWGSWSGSAVVSLATVAT